MAMHWTIAQQISPSPGLSNLIPENNIQPSPTTHI